MKYLWLLLYGVVFVWSGIHPKDQFTWVLEVVPAGLASKSAYLAETKKFPV